MSLTKQRRGARRRKLCGSDGEGCKRQDILAVIRLKFFVVSDDICQMNNGRMEGKITGLVWAQFGTGWPAHLQPVTYRGNPPR